jgi:uncharacterized protein (DUF1697 family)
VTDWALLLRAVNLGPRNKLAMADLRTALSDLGYGDVRTFLNSGNAVFTSPKRSAAALRKEIEQALHDDLGLDVRVTLRTRAQLQAALDGVPAAVADASYAVISFLLDKPTAAAVKAVKEWDVSPERLVVGDGVVYLGYAGSLHTSKLQNAQLEKRLGVASTARTPATVQKMLA